MKALGGNDVKYQVMLSRPIQHEAFQTLGCLGFFAERNGKRVDMLLAAGEKDEPGGENDEDEAKKLAAKLEKGNFDLDDLAGQLRQLRRMGGMSSMLGMLPGIGKIKKQIDAANIDESIIKRQEAIIGSMTKAERKNPTLLNGSRRRRVAAGSGTTVPEINRLMKQYQDMSGMMKRMKKLGQKGMMRHGLSALMPGAFR